MEKQRQEDAQGIPGQQPSLDEPRTPVTETLSQRKKTLDVVLWLPIAHAHTFTMQPHACIYLNIHEHIYIHMEKHTKEKDNKIERYTFGQMRCIQYQPKVYEHLGRVQGII